MRKHRGLILILGIVVLIGGCTLISAKHYRDSLATVMVISTVPDSIRSSLTVTGKVYYHETLKIDIPSGCYVEEVYLENEQFIEAGQPILKLKEEELQIAYCEKRMSAEELAQLAEAGGTVGELAYWKKKLVDDEVAVLEKIIADEGMIFAVSAGVMIQQPYENGMKTAESNCIIVGLPESGCYLEWTVPENAYREFSRGTAVVDGESINLRWKTPEYRNGAYVFSADFACKTMYVQGSPIDVQLIYVSDEYKAVLPKKCIQYDRDGLAYVYQVRQRDCNFGEESYVVKIGVTIEDQDDTNAAIKAPLTDIVLSGLDGLTEMAKVLVCDE